MHTSVNPQHDSNRAAGVLLHPTSLPGRYGIGDLGDETIAFLDWAASAGMKLWQVLRTAAEFDLNLQMRRLLDMDPPQILDIEAQLREARAENVTLDETTTMAFETAIERASAAFRERPIDLDRLEALETLVTLVHDAELPVDLRRTQNRYYRMRASVRPAIAASGNGERWLALFDALGEKLTMATSV